MARFKSKVARKSVKVYFHQKLKCGHCGSLFSALNSYNHFRRCEPVVIERGKEDVLEREREKQRQYNKQYAAKDATRNARRLRDFRAQFEKIVGPKPKVTEVGLECLHR